MLFQQQKITFEQLVSQLFISYISPVPVAGNPLMRLSAHDRCENVENKVFRNDFVHLSKTERLSQGREQKEMSFFDGISPHCLWMMITLLSQIKRWWLNYIILTIHSYQTCPGPVLPAHIVLHTGGNLSFYCKDEKVANHLRAVGAEVKQHCSWFLLQPRHRGYLTKEQPFKNKVWKNLSDFSVKEKSAHFHLYHILSGVLTISSLQPCRTLYLAWGLHCQKLNWTESGQTWHSNFDIRNHFLFVKNDLISYFYKINCHHWSQ